MTIILSRALDGRNYDATSEFVGRVMHRRERANRPILFVAPAVTGFPLCFRRVRAGDAFNEIPRTDFRVAFKFTGTAVHVTICARTRTNENTFCWKIIEPSRRRTSEKLRSSLYFIFKRSADLIYSYLDRLCCYEF